MVQEEKALQQKKRPSLPVVHEEEMLDGDLIKLQLQYFSSTALPLSLILEIMGAQWGGIALAIGAGAGIAYFAKDIHYGVEPVLRIGGKVLGLLGGAKTGGRTANRLTSKEWWMGQDVVPYVDEEMGEAIEIDLDILEALKDGNLESAVALRERARMAAFEEETGVPSFRKLLANGTIERLAKQGKMLLGYVNGEPFIGTWVAFYSCGVGGVSGTGKSTTVRFLLFQMILGGGHLIMVDPHIGDEEESLAAEFCSFEDVHLFAPCDDDENELLKRVRFLMREIQNRKKHGKGPAILFVLDEYNALVRSLSDSATKELADLLLEIAQGGRKFGIFAMIIAQRWSENDLGGKNYGAAIRSSLSSRICHRFTDEDQAKRFIGSKYGVQSLELAKGHHFFRDTEGKIRETTTPFTVQNDGEFIRKLLLARKINPVLSGEEVEEDEEEEVMVSPVRSTRASQPSASFPTAHPLDGPQMAILLLQQGYALEDITSFLGNVPRSVSVPATVKSEPTESVPSVPTTPIPVIAEKGPRAADIEIAVAVAVWNAGYNSESRLMKAFPGMTKYQAGLLRDRILEQVKEIE